MLRLMLWCAFAALVVGCGRSSSDTSTELAPSASPWHHYQSFHVQKLVAHGHLTVRMRLVNVQRLRNALKQEMIGKGYEWRPEAPSDLTMVVVGQANPHAEIEGRHIKRSIDGDLLVRLLATDSQQLVWQGQLSRSYQDGQLGSEAEIEREMARAAREILAPVPRRH